mmetsp:Transcript_636/g.2128  ORF Transcript_636/g.2128 Transcript_636/m.2128 type:complete len:261 (+) Transcript_636:359-1141(+)
MGNLPISGSYPNGPHVPLGMTILVAASMYSSIMAVVRHFSSTTPFLSRYLEFRTAGRASNAMPASTSNASRARLFGALLPTRRRRRAGSSTVGAGFAEVSSCSWRSLTRSCSRLPSSTSSHNLPSLASCANSSWLCSSPSSDTMGSASDDASEGPSASSQPPPSSSASSARPSEDSGPPQVPGSVAPSASAALSAPFPLTPAHAAWLRWFASWAWLAPEELRARAARVEAAERVSGAAMARIRMHELFPRPRAAAAEGGS